MSIFKKPFLNKVNYQSDSQVITCGGGINNVYSPEFIQDSECQDMYNFTLDDYPIVRTKVGRTMLRNPGSKGQEITYFGVTGLNYLFYIQNGILKNADGATIHSNLSPTYNKNTYYKDGNNEYLILYSSEARAKRITLPFSSEKETEDIKIKDINGDEFYPKCMTYHKGRMFATKGDMLYFSALQNPLDWETENDSGYIKVTNAKGEITAIVSYDDKLIIFTQNNMHILYGDTPSNTDTDANLFSLVDLDNSIGAYGTQLVKVHNELLYWIYGENIYEYDGSSIRNIEAPTSANGLTGGIKEYLVGITYVECENISIVGSGYNVYFYFPDLQNEGRIFIFNQKLRKWSQELQPTEEDEMYYISLVDSFNSLNYSQTPMPIYALTANGTIYEITGGDFKAGGQDEYINSDNLTYKKNIPFYYKTKKFTDGGVSKQKVLDDLWLHYDLEEGATATIKITKTANGNQTITVLENVLKAGSDMFERIMIPYKFKGLLDSYTIEIYGEGNFILKQIERKFRLKTR
jgi:hypothetical protein